MTPYYQDATVTVYAGDCRDVLRELPDCSMDSVITDPPYDLTAGKKGGSGVASVNLETPYGCARIGTGNGPGGFMGKPWDSTGVAFDPATWRLVLRVLKPGGHLLAFGGTRTSHRLVCAIEDAGFEIRDSIAWMYGSGFPKNLDVGKAIDKAAGAEREVIGPRVYVGGHIQPSSADQYLPPIGTFARTADDRLDTTPATPEARTWWQGWGTALKPAHEPIVVARKPLGGTVAANVLKWGAGAVNVDACRIEGDSRPLREHTGRSGDVYGAGLEGSRAVGSTSAGRWPANVVLDEHAAAELDVQSGNRKAGGNLTGNEPSRPAKDTYGDYNNRREWQSYGDQGGPSRFFYTAKADSGERVRVNGTAHPTVKPLSLMRWLVRLVTPPGGTVLEPFAGSGTTVEAAILEGFRCVAIEREPDYLPLIVQRINRRRDPVAAVKAAEDDRGLFDLLDGAP